MPRNTPVDRLYRALLGEGKSPESAARIAQSATKKSLATGKRPKTGPNAKKSP
jgi:hypothetical protein